MRVVVVGGGIAGLACGWSLRHGPPQDPTTRDDVEVVVLDAADRLGGKLRTAQLAGAPYDVGAEAFLARRPEADRLARRVGLADALEEPAQLGVWLWSGDRLRRFPARTVFGVPADPAALAASGVLSARSVARAVGEELRPRAPLHDDASIAAALVPRFGRELVDTLVEPLLGGIYAGSVDRLSVRSATPVLAAAAVAALPLSVSARRHRRVAARATGPVFRTVRGGMGRLVDTLAGSVHVRRAVAAVALEADGDGWVVHTTDGPEPCDHVVLALPGQPAAELLTPVAPVAATALRAVPYASSAVVATAWPAARATLPRGSGLLVPRSAGRLVKAATWSSHKWEHLGADGLVRIRFSVGRVDDRRGLEHEDRILTELVLAEARELLDLRGEPADVVVARWPDGLPQYDVGHEGRVAAIHQGLPAGVHVTGALYDGVGVAPVIGHAERVAAAIRAAG